MRKFFDAVADAHFVPQEDGTVRFALPKPNAGYLVLDAAQADGARIIWRPLVRYYVYACHACVPLSFGAPWVGLLLILTLWLIAYCLIQEIRHRYNPEVGQDESQHERFNYQLSRLISRRLAFWSRLVAWLVFILAVYTLLFHDVVFGFDVISIIPSMLVATRWSAFFGALLSSPKAKGNWAQAVKPQHAMEARTEG